MEDLLSLTDLTKSTAAIFFAEKIVSNVCSAKVPDIFFGKKW